ncbi:MAG: hypothetical protein ABIH50_07205 [bacterium]
MAKFKFGGSFGDLVFLSVCICAGGYSMTNIIRSEPLPSLILGFFIGASVVFLKDIASLLFLIKTDLIEIKNHIDSKKT